MKKILEKNEDGTFRCRECLGHGIVITGLSPTCADDDCASDPCARCNQSGKEPCECEDDVAVKFVNGLYLCVDCASCGCDDDNGPCDNHNMHAGVQ